MNSVKLLETHFSDITVEELEAPGRAYALRELRDEVKRLAHGQLDQLLDQLIEEYRDESVTAFCKTVSLVIRLWKENWI